MGSSSITFIPPVKVAQSASRALCWRSKRPKAGTRIGWARAHQLANRRPVSIRTVKRMKAYFDRHAIDSFATGWFNHEPNFPTPGRVMWDAWGGNAGRSWVEKIIEKQKRSGV